MRKHRSLTLTKFVAVIDPDRMRRYLASLTPNVPPTAWAEINGPVLEQWLEEPENVHVAEIIREDFRRINDICTDGMPSLVRAFKRAEIPVDQDLPSVISGLYRSTELSVVAALAPPTASTLPSSSRVSV